MSTLLIDAGNSRIKWAQLAQGRWTRQGADEPAEALAAWSGLEAPARVVVSNVAGPLVQQTLVRACAGWRLAPEFIAARARQCGVSNHYQQVEALGSDRWAALIAAWHIERRACLVVNCGTATTVDALSEAGEFLGGLILPGITLMQQSLLARAAQLREAPGVVCDFPCNTADAIVSGAVAATVGAVLRQYALLDSPQAPCLLSGGAAGQLLDSLAELPLAQVDNLVLHGLQRIAEETR
jgi:type III pantothenate kinase